MGHLVEKQHEKILIADLNNLVNDLVKARHSISMTLNATRNTLRNILPEGDRLVLDILLSVIIDYFDVSVDDMKSDSRQGIVMRARRIFGAMGYHRTKASYAYVGRIINKDHASIMNHCKRIKQYEETNDHYYDEYLEIEALLDVKLNRLNVHRKSRKDEDIS